MKKYTFDDNDLLVEKQNHRYKDNIMTPEEFKAMKVKHQQTKRGKKKRKK